MAKTASRKSRRRESQQKGEGRTGRRRGARRGGAQMMGESGAMASMMQAGEEGRRVMEKTAEEQVRMGRQGLKQAEELSSRTAPWWGPMWGMWDAWDIARSWTELNMRIWETATRAMRGETVRERR